MNRITIHFDDEDYDPIDAEKDSWVSMVLDHQDSPVTFGCRSGLCGTCAVEVSENARPLPPPDEGEQETLDLVWPGRKNLRLACLLKASCDMKLKPVD